MSVSNVCPTSFQKGEFGLLIVINKVRKADLHIDESMGVGRRWFGQGPRIRWSLTWSIKFNSELFGSIVGQRRGRHLCFKSDNNRLVHLEVRTTPRLRVGTGRLTRS